MVATTIVRVNIAMDIGVTAVDATSIAVIASRDSALLFSPQYSLLRS